MRTKPTSGAPSTTLPPMPVAFRLTYCTLGSAEPRQVPVGTPSTLRQTGCGDFAGVEPAQSSCGEHHTHRCARRRHPAADPPSSVEASAPWVYSSLSRDRLAGTLPPTSRHRSVIRLVAQGECRLS
jgi:hypothetical protein